MSEEIDPFVALRDTLEADLKDRGFQLDEHPPAEEPRIREKLSPKTSRDLSNLYDEFLMYYDYLSNDLTNSKVYYGVTKARLVKITAEVSSEAKKVAELTNPESRKNWVLTHPDVVQGTCDFLYYEQLVEATEERRRRISKSMDRIWRELLSRQSRPSRGREVPQNSYTPNTYKDKSDDEQPPQRRPRPFNLPRDS